MVSREYSVKNLKRVGQKYIVMMVSCFFLLLTGCSWGVNEEKQQAIALNDQGVQLHAEGSYIQAIDLFNEALAYLPQVKEIHYNKGLAYYALGNYAHALESYDAALMIDANYIQALSDKGLALSSMGKYDEALTYFEQVLHKDPKNIYTLNNKGFTYYKMGQYESALKYYDKALSVDPTFARALSNKGVIIADMGNMEKALTYFDDALLHDPDDYLNRYNKGSVLSDMGYTFRRNKETQDKAKEYSEKALKAFSQTLVLKPDYIDALVYRAITHFDLEEYDKTLLYTKKVLDTVQHTNALYYQAKAYAALGDTQAAIDGFTTVLKIDPTNEYAAQELVDLGALIED